MCRTNMAGFSEDLHQSEQKKTTIMIVDDHPLVRDAIKSHLDKQPDFQVVAEAGDGEEAVRLAIELLPDIIIMDVTMPGMDGIEATSQIKARCPDIRILALSMHDTYDQIVKILVAGASAYLTKSIFGEEISKAVRAIVSGESILPAKALHQVLKKSTRQPLEPCAALSSNSITLRELEILKMAAMGMSNENIAAVLNLSSRTIKAYFAEIFSKLNVHSRTGAVIVALKAGLFNLEDIHDGINKI